MNNLDDVFARLGASPVHPRLAMIDDRVFADMARTGGASEPMAARSFGIAALIALGMGVIGASLPGLPVKAAPPMSPLGVSPALTPSSLLGTSG